MIPVEKMRRLEVWVIPPDAPEHGRWEVVADLGRLEPEDRFRMFEPDGQPVTDSEGRTEWVVVATPGVQIVGIVDDLTVSPAAGVVNTR